jgi:nitrite reductase (NO-forming)
MFRRSRLVLSLSAFALFATACASAPDGAIEAEALACPPESDCYDPARSIGEGGALEITAVEFDFPTINGIAAEGDVGITIVNEGTALHNIVVVGANEGSDPKAEAAAGESDTATFNLFAGDYVIFCDVPGHRAAGMEDEITVYTTAADAPASEEPVDGASEDASAEPTEAEPTEAEPTETEASEPAATETASEA